MGKTSETTVICSFRRGCIDAHPVAGNVDSECGVTVGASFRFERDVVAYNPTELLEQDKNGVAVISKGEGPRPRSEVASHPEPGGPWHLSLRRGVYHNLYACVCAIAMILAVLVYLFTPREPEYCCLTIFDDPM